MNIIVFFLIQRTGSNCSKKMRTWKAMQINNKQLLEKGAVQLNLHDGTNVLASNDYKTFDTVILDNNHRS